MHGPPGCTRTFVLEVPGGVETGEVDLKQGEVDEPHCSRIVADQNVQTMNEGKLDILQAVDRQCMRSLIVEKK